jgi:ribonuclease D
MIDSEQKLAGLLPKLREASWIAVDTEADSLHAYPEKLCLIQLSVTGADELVDPLVPLDFKDLVQVLRSHELIMHGADYDLRLLRKHFNFVPHIIFDTMLASRLLGVREFGLTNLVHQYLGVKLEKGPQKANWARRPLTERMVAYARNDTRYLKPLADILRAELREKGRLKWHQEACTQLIGECSQLRVTDPDEVWRVKGSQHLEPAALAVLRELWHWREQEAIRTNKPPFFILSPELMVHLARAAVDPRNNHPPISANMSAHRREAIHKAVARGLEVKSPPSRLMRRNSYRQSEAERRRMHELQRRRNKSASELGIDPTLIASRATLVLLAKDWDLHQKELMPWQRELLKDA